MKTKNYEMYFGFYHGWWDWALPVRISVKNLDKDYFETYLQILCFHFSFTRASHTFSEKVDKMFGGKYGD